MNRAQRRSVQSDNSSKKTITELKVEAYDKSLELNKLKDKQDVIFKEIQAINQEISSRK